MPGRSDVAVGVVVVLALGLACSGPPRNTRQVIVGHHRVRFVLPESWEHLDHGRQQLLRLGHEQISLVDLGPATRDAFAREIGEAEALWHAGRKEDAFQRISLLRSRTLGFTSSGQRYAFWRPWTDATYVPESAEPAAVDRAFTALHDKTRELEDPSPDVLLEHVLAHATRTRGREVASRTRRTIHDADWMEILTWNQVSHQDRVKTAFLLNDGHLLAFVMDHGLFERIEPGYEAVLASLEVTADTARVR